MFFAANYEQYHYVYNIKGKCISKIKNTAVTFAGISLEKVIFKSINHIYWSCSILPKRRFYTTAS